METAMKIFFVFLMGLIGANAFAQDSWKICLDKKNILTASVEDAEKNIVKINASDLRKNKNLIINYKETTPQKGWERTIAVYDEKDQEIKKHTGKKWILATTELKTLFEKSGALKFYTLYLPEDPKLKSQVRVRRVHLCTLILQE